VAKNKKKVDGFDSDKDDPHDVRKTAVKGDAKPEESDSEDDEPPVGKSNVSKFAMMDVEELER
jgi:hypothetical protein